jgi:hypothetical protein
MAVSVKQNKKAGEEHAIILLKFSAFRLIGHWCLKDQLYHFMEEGEDRQSLIICIQLVGRLQYAIHGRFNCLVLKFTDVR